LETHFINLRFPHRPTSTQAVIIRSGIRHFMEQSVASEYLSGRIRYEVIEQIDGEFQIRINQPSGVPLPEDLMPKIEKVILDFLNPDQTIQVHKESPKPLPTTAGELFKDLDE